MRRWLHWNWEFHCLRICWHCTFGLSVPGSLHGNCDETVQRWFCEWGRDTRILCARWGHMRRWLHWNCELHGLRIGGYCMFGLRVPGDMHSTFSRRAHHDPAEKTKGLSAGPAKGRLAIMAIVGMFLQDGLAGSACGACALYTASPRRAFDNELGVPAPVGVCDPDGFTAEGSYGNFASNCQTERRPISVLAMWISNGSRHWVYWR